MTDLTFKKVDTITDKTRTMTIKEKVTGYKKVINKPDSVVFKRGSISIIITISENDYTFIKFNHITQQRESFTYDDVRKYFDFT